MPLVYRFMRVEKYTILVKRRNNNKGSHFYLGRKDKLIDSKATDRKESLIPFYFIIS